MTTDELERRALATVTRAHYATELMAPIGTTPQVGAIVWIFSRGAYRRGIVEKVGTSRVHVFYTTLGAVDKAAKDTQYAQTHPNCFGAERLRWLGLDAFRPVFTRKSAPLSEIFVEVSA